MSRIEFIRLTQSPRVEGEPDRHVFIKKDSIIAVFVDEDGYNKVRATEGSWYVVEEVEQIINLINESRFGRQSIGQR